MNERYRFRIGKFLCIAINDGRFVGNAAMLFANAPEDELGQVLDRYGAVSDALPSTWTCLLVQTDTHTVLIDTGVGDAEPRGGNLLRSLQKEGISPEDIDVVVLTHIHGDHILGCVRENGDLTFPKSSHVLGKEEWRFWTTEKTLKTAPEWAARTARRVLPALSENVSLIEGPGSIVPGIDVLPAPGHTVGHIAVEIKSQGERLTCLADAALHPIHLEYPHWTAVVDQLPEQTIQTRLALYERAVRLESLVLLFHFQPFPSLGYVVKQENSWRWKAVDASSE